MLNENKTRILRLGYFSAFLAGCAFPLAGILSPQIASSLSIRTENIVFVDGLFLIGLTLGSIVSGRLLSVFLGRKSIFIASGLLMLINVGFAVQNSVLVYTTLVFCNGLFMGILIAAVNFLIISGFQSNDNSCDSKLNIMQFFVGIGCFAGAAAVGFISAYLSWRAVFAIISLLYMLIVIFSKIIIISENYKKEEVYSNGSINKKNSCMFFSVPGYIILVGLAMIAYVYAEYVVSYWFSPYLQLDRGIDIKMVGLLLSMFWLTLAIGRLLIGKYVLPFVNEKYCIVFLSLVMIAGFILFLMFDSIVITIISVFILGIGCSAVFPTLLAYGMKLSEGASPYMLSFLVMCGFLGGFLSLICSASLGTVLPRNIPIIAGPIWAFLIICILIFSAKIKKQNRK